jgi:hypothetical protein
MYVAWIDSAKRRDTKKRRVREAVGLLAAGKKPGLKQNTQPSCTQIKNGWRRKRVGAWPHHGIMKDSGSRCCACRWRLEMRKESRDEIDTYLAVDVFGNHRDVACSCVRDW